jgi:hypothetical protein
MNTRMDELRNERLAELGITQAQANEIKTLLEANNYRVDMDYFWSINLKYETLKDSPLASLTFGNGLFVMTNSSSHWTFDIVQEYKKQVDKVLELMTAIHAIAPTVVDPTFRNKKAEEQRAKDKEARLAKIAKWNALPEKETILYLSTGAELVQLRSKIEYREHYRTEFWLGYKLNEQHFSPYQFITKDGRVQRKKFVESYRHLPAQDVDTLLNALVTLDKRSNAARNGSF